MPEVKFDTEKMAELMDKLIKDEAFRQKFQSDPKAVFADYNMDIPDELIPENVELPGPDELEARKTKTSTSITSVFL
jgi:hypothetical protein